MVAMLKYSDSDANQSTDNASVYHWLVKLKFSGSKTIIHVCQTGFIFLIDN